MQNTKSESTVLSIQKSRVGDEIPKEGGWGWIVVFSSFMIYLLSLGLILSFEPILTEFSTYFKKSRYETKWVISIPFGISFLVGPIASGLTNKYGCRKTTIVGALLMSVGMLVAIPAPNLFYLYVTFGPAVGTGLGLMSIPAIIIINSYFEKKRALGVGIAMCGSGIGTISFPHIIKFLISYYQCWQSAMLIIAGIVLNMVIFGALYREPEIRIIPVEQYRDEGNEDVMIFEPIRDSPTHPLERNHAFENGPIERTQSEPLLGDRDFITESMRTAQSNLEMEIIGSHEPESPDSWEFLSFPPPASSSKSKKDLKESGSTTRKQVYAITPFGTVKPLSGASQNTTVSGLLYRKDIFYSADLAMVPEYRNNSLEDYETLVTSVVEIEKEEKEVWHLIPREVWDGLNNMIGLSLLRNNACQVILLGRFITCFGLMTPYYYITERAIEDEIPNGRILISIIGISNTFGRVGIGLIANHRKIDRVLLQNVWITVCGIAIACLGLFSSFIIMTIVCVIYGLTSGGFVAIVPIILVDVLGMANLTNAFGLVKLVQGLSYFVALPIPGLIRDRTDSYSYSFLSSGILVLSSIIPFCSIPYFSKRQNHKRDKKTEKQNPES